jgi:Exportin 1-like protein
MSSSSPPRLPPQQNYLPRRLSDQKFVYISFDVTTKAPRLIFNFQVTFDLHQVDPQNIITLRDTLFTALERYQNGPRTIIVQLCLALSGLAVQLPAWDNPVQSLADLFGRNPATVPVLLQFLTVLPEELASNTKIPITVSFQPLPIGLYNLI